LVSSGSISGSSAITVNAGAILDASTRSDGTLTVASGRTLAGNGTIWGSVTVSPGATISPGSSVGTLTVTNVVTLQGTTFVELNKSLNTNDMIAGAKSIIFGGTLALTNLSGSVAAGDSFKLFSATNYSGSFTNLSPAIPALNLGWNTNTLTADGTLRIVTAPTPQPQISSINLIGSNLVLGGTNGVPGWPYYVLSGTNVLLPLASWSRIATNTFDATGAFTFGVPTDIPQRFFALQLF
jgi:hypothetical protein